MATIILVHGAWHGAWCWYRLAPILESHGQDVKIPDLPGHGKNLQPIATVTLQDYTDSICKVIHDLARPVMLVGHSMSGIVISRVAEILPDKICQLVYLSGFLLQDGQSMLEMTQQDEAALVMHNLMYSRDRKTATIKPEILIPAFYADCDEEDIELARSHISAQALQPIATPVHITANNWGRVPRAYIECIRDRAVTIQAQRKMVSSLPCEQVFTLDTGHSPFFSAPGLLARYLVSLNSRQV